MNNYTTISRQSPTSDLVAAALAAIETLVYSDSLTHGFTLDSSFLLLRDPRIQKVTAPNLKLILTREYWFPGFYSAVYRPFTTLTCLFNSAVLGSGSSPVGYHVVNLMLHIGNAWLIFAIRVANLAPPGASVLRGGAVDRASDRHRSGRQSGGTLRRTGGYGDSWRDAPSYQQLSSSGLEARMGAAGLPGTGCVLQTEGARTKLNVSCPASNMCLTWADLAQSYFKGRKRTEALFLKRTALDRSCPADLLDFAAPA